MIGQIDKSSQLEIFRVPLRHIVPNEDRLVRLAHLIRWDNIEKGLSIHYSPDKGRKAIPVRKMAGMVILKDMFEMTDEALLKQWLNNPVFQYFCGEVYRQKEPPFNRSELVRFRHRIGIGGMGVIFSPDVLIMIDELHEEEKSVTPSYAEWYFMRLFKKLMYNSKRPVEIPTGK